MAKKKQIEPVGTVAPSVLIIEDDLDPRWRAVRVIVFSGYDEHVNVARLERLGVGHVLQKGSVDPAHILKLVG